MPPPTVSVVIPTYNAPDLLLETLASVFAQTLTDFEVIVVNDGSTDDTAEHLAAVADPRLRVVSQENQGIGAARNRGIDEARGTYVALLDHDDLWRPAKLATQVAFLQSHPQCAAATVPFSYSNAPGRCVFDLTLRNAQGIIERPMHELACSRTLLISSSIMFDRNKAEGLRYATRRRCIEDVPFQLGLFSRGAFGVAGDDILMVYRFHETNYSSQVAFYANGIRLLREMDAGGAFSSFQGVQRRDLLACLAQTGRTACVKQLLAGPRRSAWRSYLEEFAPQLRLGRLKFLVSFPLMLAMPRTAVRRRWKA